MKIILLPFKTFLLRIIENVLIVICLIYIIYKFLKSCNIPKLIKKNPYDASDIASFLVDWSVISDRYCNWAV